MFVKFDCTVTNGYKVRNEELRRRAGIERELGSRSESIEMVWACGKNG